MALNNVRMTPCAISAPVKRRTGTPRYWCSIHHAPAWDRNGSARKTCLRADKLLPTPANILKLDPSRYPGGVGMWGCLAPAYNSSSLPPEVGIHVHARPSSGSEKLIDGTYPWVELQTPAGPILIDGDAARHATIANVLGLELEYRECPHCHHPHLDEDWFAVNPHRKHQCMACGRDFFGDTSGISNPLAGLNATKNDIRVAPRRLELVTAEHPGGIQVWGSNAAILWTSKREEESGIHIHTYATRDARYGQEAIDETFGTASIDGHELNARQIQIYMAQTNLPHLAGQVESLQCNACSTPLFDEGPHAVKPRTSHTCADCGQTIVTRKAVVSNPAHAQLKALGSRVLLA